MPNDDEEIFLDPSEFIGDLEPPYDRNGQLVRDLRFTANGKKYRLPVLVGTWKIIAEADAIFEKSDK
jgi:hypothetical protein